MGADQSPPTLGTTNDVAAVDPAVRRRCAFVLSFADALSAEQERLAWRRLLGLEPPPGWRPCGAAVADVVLAAERCRMLGLADAASLQAAIVAARAERTGIATAATGATGAARVAEVSEARARRHTRH